MSEVAMPSRADADMDRGVKLCSRRDLVANSGVVVWHDGHQIAIFLISHPSDATGKSLSSPPESTAELYALDNRDPFSGANVIGRGIVGDLEDELVVASPIYKQHFRLRDGQCLEDAEQCLRPWPVAFHGDDVVLLQEEPNDPI